MKLCHQQSHFELSVISFCLKTLQQFISFFQARGKWKDNCVFTDHLADNAFTEFRSVKYNKTLIAFNRSGRPRQVSRPFKVGIKAFQFIERALNIRLYKGRRYKISNGKGSNRIDLYRRKHPYDKIFVSYKKWREFKRWLKLSKKKETKKRIPLTTAPESRVQTTVQIANNNTTSITLLQRYGVVNLDRQPTISSLSSGQINWRIQKNSLSSWKMCLRLLLLTLFRNVITAEQCQQ